MRRLMFRKPENESVTAAYEWAQQVTGEACVWIGEYYWTKPMKLLKIKLPLAKRCLIALTGLQGTGKTIGLKMLAAEIKDAGESILCFKWTKNWIEQLEKDDEDFRQYYRDNSLRAAFREAVCAPGRKLTPKVQQAYNPTMEDFGLSKVERNVNLMEEMIGKVKSRELKRTAVMGFLREKRYIFIDMPDYSKTDARFMSVDLDELQALWNRITQESSESDTTIVVTLQKELSKGKHFFIGKFDVVELPLLTPKELIEVYKMRFKSVQPFSEDALELIAKLSRGVFRRFQRYCRLTIEEFMLDEKEPPITVDYAERAITEKVLFDDMELELYDKFKSEGQRKLAVEMLSLLVKRRGEEMSQKQIADALNVNEMAVSRITNVLTAERYITRERVQHGWLLKMS